MKLKTLLQETIRVINLLIFKKQLPNKISIYFHEIEKEELIQLQVLILYFKEKGYKFMSLSELNKNLNNKDKIVSITFDDGFSNWSRIIPYFNEHDVEATFFINSIIISDEPIDQYLKYINCASADTLINETEIGILVENNHEIGAHTHGHSILAKMNFEEFTADISKNKKFLKRYTTINSFAIPFGMRRYVTKKQIDYLNDEFECIAYGEPGMLFNQKKGVIQRYPWKSNKSLKYNINNISTDTSMFNFLTKRSGLG